VFFSFKRGMTSCLHNASFARSFDMSWAMFSTTARPMVGPQPLHSVNTPSSLTTRVSALPTHE
jgi:hypothetical protein